MPLNRRLRTLFLTRTPWSKLVI